MDGAKLDRYVAREFVAVEVEALDVDSDNVELVGAPARRDHHLVCPQHRVVPARLRERREIAQILRDAAREQVPAKINDLNAGE